MVNVFSHVLQYWHEVRGKVRHNLKYHCNMVQSIQVGNMVRAEGLFFCQVYNPMAEVSKSVKEPTNSASVSKSEVFENVSSAVALNHLYLLKL